MKHKALTTLLWTLAMVLVALLLGSFVLSKGKASYTIRPINTKVTINEKSGEAFVEQKEVIRHLPFDIEDSTLIAVQTAQVESLLLVDVPYIRSVNTFISPSTHTLNIELESRTPILRYLQGGKWYFLDEKGEPMVTRNGASAYVPVAVGHIDQETCDDILYPLALYLQENKNWASFFSLVEVVSPKKIWLYPRVGDYIFELQGLDNLDQNLAKVPIFYQKIVPQVGANKYKLVKLSFEGQIVCQRKGKR